jgi:hypothetical protein
VSRLLRPGLALAAGFLVACAPAPDRAIGSSSGTPAPAAASKAGVSGFVRAGEGDAIASARVLAESIDQPARAVPEMAAMTGADGHYHWPLQPGRYRLRFFAEGFAEAAVEVTVPPSGGAVVDVVLAKAV